MKAVSVEKLSKALYTLQRGYESVLTRNSGAEVSDESIMWCEYYIKKMLLVLADAERGKEPFDRDIVLDCSNAKTVKQRYNSLNEIARKS